MGDNYVSSLDLEWVVTLACLLLWWGRWWRTPCSPPCWWGWSWSRCEVERMLVACLGRRANTAPSESCSCKRKESSWIALKMCFLNWVWSINKIILFLLHIFRASNIVWFFHSLSIFFNQRLDLLIQREDKLISMCLQVAKGMEYLAIQNCPSWSQIATRFTACEWQKNQQHCRSCNQ